MKKKMGIVLIAVVLLLTSGMSVLAEGITAEETASIEQNKNKPFIALGADLTASQRETVLSLMGITEADLENYTVIYVTNEQEHRYLDPYLDTSLIGSKSLSSVMVKQAEKGHGVVVTTKNIDYCTTGMYRNALLTAGVEDADILVVGPFHISGTAGLIGALRVYEEMSGEEISDETLDIAMDELITTGEIVAGNTDAEYGEEVEALIAYIKAKLAEGTLKTDEDIRAAIEEAQEKFGVSLSGDEIQKIIDVMNKIDQLGLDPSALLDQAKDLYAKYGEELFSNPDKALGDLVKTAITTFFSNIGKAISEFFKGLFS